MATVAPHRPDQRAPATEVPVPAPAPRAGRMVARAGVIAGLGLAYLVVHDGSTSWRSARLGLAAVSIVAIGRAARRTSPGAGWALSAAGAIFLSIGVGIGGPHLAKAANPQLVAAALLFGGGLVLLVSGTARVLRPLRWSRAPALLAVLALTAAAVAVVGQAVAATNVPPTALGDRTPATLGLRSVEASFLTADGIRLSAWYVPSRTGAAVVILHGAGSTRSSTLDQAAALARHGFGALLVDARGHGRSGGRAMDFGWYGDLDVGAAVAYLRGRSDVDPGRIGLLGLSMGGEEAIGAARAVEGVRAVVAEGATTRTAADKAWLSDRHGPLGAIQEGIDHLVYGLTDLLTAARPPVALRRAVAESPRTRFLLIAGGAVPDEADAGRFIRSGRPAAVELWVVPGAGHTAGLDRDAQGWERRVVAFLRATLAPR